LITLGETQTQLQAISDKETSSRDMYLKLQSKTNQLEEQVSNLTREKNQLLAQFETEKLRNSMIAESKSK
jgi:phage shock protein A